MLKDGDICKDDDPIEFLEQYHLHTEFMYDQIWLEKGVNVEDIVTSCYDFNIGYSQKYMDLRKEGWKSLSKQLIEMFWNLEPVSWKQTRFKSQIR